jgi:hypothetical protein
MAGEDITAKFDIADDEKATQMMVYITQGIYWGTVITKQGVRLSTWLRGQAAPDYMRLLDTKGLITTAGGQPKPVAFKETNIPAEYILAYHMLPPAQDPVDYDVTEPNRSMIPVTMGIGTFFCNGFLRISTISTLAKFLDATKEVFTSVYDAEINCPIMPSLGTLKIPYLQVRKNNTIFCLK